MKIQEVTNMSQINELKIQKDYIKGSIQVTYFRTTRPKRALGYHTTRDPCETKVKKHNGHNTKVKLHNQHQITSEKDNDKRSTSKTKGNLWD